MPPDDCLADGEIVEADGGVQLNQFPACYLEQICGESFRRSPLDKDQSGEVAAVALDHDRTYHAMIRGSIEAYARAAHEKGGR